MLRHFAALVVAGWLLAPAHAADPATGNWKINYIPNAAIEVTDCIIKLEMKDGKWEASVVAKPASSGETTIDSVSMKNGVVQIVMKKGAQQFTVEAVPGKDSKKMAGSWGNDRVLYPAMLTWTEDEKIEGRGFGPRDLPAPMKKAMELNGQVTAFRRQIAQAKTDDEKNKLKDEMAAKQKEVDAELPKLYKQTLVEHGESAAALDAATSLLRAAKKINASNQDAKHWVDAALNIAAAHGPRMRLETMFGIAEICAATDGLQSMAAELARDAQKKMGADATTQQQVRAMTILVMALDKTNPADARPLAAKLETLEKKLDDEYLTKQPKLKVEPFKGREGDGNQVVLLELFTGAECPPCVAADVAFDWLPAVYKPADVILLQYHEHIPRPDALTNSDSEERFQHYAKAFSEEVGGTPSTLFNGKPAAGGGGGIGNAEGKLKEYRKVIEPLFAEKAKAKISLNAHQSGDTITLSASVSDLEEPNDKIKLRFALVEEVVRYPGGNGLRLHHHVVRAMPGGVDGIALGGKNESREVTVNIPELRGKLSRYLDDYVANKGAIPRPQRPMEMKHLKAVCWVQDDKTHAVLNAAQADIGSHAAGE